MRGLFCIILIIFSASVGANRVDLLSCFADAVTNDPTYQAQFAIYMAAVQQVPESRSAVLPQVSLSGAIAREYNMQGQLGSGTFHTNNFTVQANQTIFNYTQFKQITQAKYSVKSAFATLSAQQQELMMRISKAYLDVLQAHDLLEFAEQQKGYIKRQLDATKTLFDHSDATITDLEQAQGAYDLINADFFAAQIRLYDNIQTLSQITGIYYHDFTYLNSNFPLLKPNPQKIEAWTQTANAHNWNLQAARLNIWVAREALSAIKGNFLPSLNATGSVTTSEIPSLLLVDTVPNKINSIGLNATWNVLQGGLTVAQMRAASATLKQYKANMRQQFLKTMADTRKAYNTIVVGVSRVQSARASLIANTKAINHAEEAYKAGEMSITEILQIQYQLYRAQVQYAEYVYNYLFNLLLLKEAAGTLNVESLAAINSFLDHKRK